jgi:hypothetical protein
LAHNEADEVLAKAEGCALTIELRSDETAPNISVQAAG